MVSWMVFVRLRSVSLVMTLSLVAGCHAHAPDGQVLAIVNNKKVTQRDLAAYLAAANLPKGVDVKAIQPAVINGLINLKLLVQQAKHQGLDKSPDYPALVNRAQELLLARQLVSIWASKVPTPTQQDAQAFIDSNPQIFSSRKIYLLDQIHTRSAGLDLDVVGPLPSMDAVIAHLRQQNHPFWRGSGALDTLAVPAQTAQDIAELAPGEPLFTNRGGTLVISAVTKSEPAPVPDDQRIALATRVLKRENTRRVIINQIKGLRADSKISYPSGFVSPSPTPRS